MGHLTALPMLLMASACSLFVDPGGVAATYNIGVGIADVTGPSAEVGFVSIPSCLSIFSKPTHAVLICSIFLQSRAQ
jgi:hypothetical protein